MVFEPIAIVGRACVLPGALTPEALWEAVAAGRDLLGSAEPGRWGLPHSDVLCAPDGSTTGGTADRAWSDRGGYVRGFDDVFDPDGFGVPAAELMRLDPLFRWTLHTAREALRDAGIEPGPGGRRERTGAVLGNLSFPSSSMSRFAESVWLGDLREAAGVPEIDPHNRFTSSLPALLLRRALGLCGDAFALDAACASALYALKYACDRLHDRRADVMLAGAVNRSDDLFLHVGFCALEALSKSGRSRPFHRDADGLVPAEGAGFVVLKRLADAVADGNPIYAVVRGIGLSNDGRGKGILAPSADGQERAIRSAYGCCDLSPADVSLLECHATGTTVGDATEIASTARVFAGRRDVPVGSLKSNLGHLVTAAGVAALIKVLEAMRAGVRPPSLHADEPSAALAGSPFRVLRTAEPWESDGPRRAGVSAFGFGGNNAHVIVEEFRPGARVPRSQPTEPAGAVAVVGIGARVAATDSRDAFADAFLSGAVAEDTAAVDVALSLRGLRFPPNDLRQSLPQQLLVLAAAREAVAETSALPGERTAVLIGMEADAEVARYGARWRLVEWARRLRAGAAWASDAKDAFVGRLRAPGVVGTMPNVPANRLNGQFDLGGGSCVVSAGEASGLIALDSAVRSLRTRELDAALVGAVDLCCESVHRAAASAVLPADRRRVGDAAVVLVLKRVEDARRDGDRIYALLEDDDAGGTREAARTDAPAPDLVLDVAGVAERFGHAHAASGLVGVAAAALALERCTLPGGRPWLCSGPRSATVDVTAMEGLRARTRLVRAPDAARRAAGDGTRLHVFGGADAAAVLQALDGGREAAPAATTVGPARLVIVAADEEQFARRARRARAHLSGGAPPGAGVHFRATPIEGETAFVFTGAGAAYHGMGRELLLALPELGDALAERFPALPDALGWAYGDPGHAPDVGERLWGASSLSQVHALLSRDVLGLRAGAAIGYSSGESNALVAMGAWTDMAAMHADAQRSGLFDRELGGRFEAVSRVWGRPASWAVWTAVAPIEEIRAAVANEERVHLAIVHSPGEGVVAGDAEGCARAVRRLGANRCRRLRYDVAAHVPEVEEVRESWLALHRRPVTPVPGVRFYTNATGAPYEPDTETCAQAILGQAWATLDFPRTIERAYHDGVRVFIEHGPRGACGRWIRDVLAGRDAVIVALDREGRGLGQVWEAVAALVAAGVPVAHERLAERLAPAPAPADAGPALRLPAHWPPVQLPPLPARVPAAVTASPGPADVVGLQQRFALQVAELDRMRAETLAHQEALVRHLHALRSPSSGAPPAVVAPVTPVTPPPTAPAAAALPGPRFERRDLEVHASGLISTLFGPQFAAQDGRAVQVRMPEPPLLLADRVIGLDAEPASMSTGTIWTETDVVEDAWYLHDGRMPAGVMIESGQADLMLISYLGIDLVTGGDRAYRLLGCDLTYHGEPPRPGETLRYDIHVDGHARQGDVRLFFFHYDCHVGDDLRLSVRNGQAGFFTKQELADSDGILWTPQDARIVPDPRLDEPAVACARTSFDREQVRAFAAGRPWDCFGPAFSAARAHVRTPRTADGRMQFLGEVTHFEIRGGPWGRGYLRAETAIRPDDWYFDGHFKNDPCMPGTLMFEGCLQAMAFHLAGLGYTLSRDGWRFRPVAGETLELRCRGQVTPTSRLLVYEVFVEEVVDGPLPTLFADLLCTVDGLKAFHARRVALELVPDWPLDARPELLRGYVETRPVARAGGHEFGYAALLATALGRPSDAFGPMYRPFDGPRRVARLPGPPYHFMTRVTRIDGEPGALRDGVSVELEYDIPPDAWYFGEGSGAMPFCVLLEAGLQPCGWLASFAGSALAVDEDVSFRNLDGRGTVHAELLPGAGRLRTEVRMTSVSRAGGMLIEAFEVRCHQAGRLVFEVDTVFGFFPERALAEQVGLPTTDAQRELFDRPSPFVADLRGGDPRLFDGRCGLPSGRLLVLDRVTGYWPGAGTAGLGQLRAEAAVDPSAWFFKAHFFTDPVQPGSLGLEAMLQLLRFYVLERGLSDGVPDARVESVALERDLTWKYRGQVLPGDGRITTTLEIERVERERRGVLVVAAASLWIDGKRIYEADGLALRVVAGT